MGRPAKTPVHLFDLDEVPPPDDAGLPLPGPQGLAETPDLFLPKTKPQQGLLKRLSARHHRLAQCLAEGIPPGEAGIICGYAGSRVSVLQTDAAFRELVAFYTAQRQEAFAQTGEKLAVLAATAIDILQDRLEDTPDEFNPSQLLAVVQTAADRSGHGPSSTQRNVSIAITGEDLDRLRAEALGNQPGRVKIIPAQQGTSGDAGVQPATLPPKAEEPGRPEGAPV